MAKQILLAISVGDQPRWPPWAQALREAGGCVKHLYDLHPTDGETTVDDETIVIGGGISAVQTAVHRAQRSPKSVTLLMRHDLRIESFDSPPGWMGPKEMRNFLAEPSMTRRRSLIAGARRPGSVPDDVARSLRRAERCGMLRRIVGEVQCAELRPDGTIELTLEDRKLRARHVILATGFDQHRPGGDWLASAIATYELPIAPCGYPIVKPTLQWAHGLYATGALAELELGPAARNIVGARHAGDRLAPR